MKYLLLLLCSISLQADWEDWNESNKELFKNYIYLNMIDAHQTYTLTNQFNSVFENNPVYGKKPSLEKIILVKGVSTYVIYKALDNKNINTYSRKVNLKIINTVYLGVILNNGYIGFDLRKEF